MVFSLRDGHVARIVSPAPATVGAVGKYEPKFSVCHYPAAHNAVQHENGDSIARNERKLHDLPELVRVGIRARVEHAEPLRHAPRPVAESAECEVEEGQRGGVVLRLGEVRAVVIAVQLGAHEEVVEPPGAKVQIAVRYQALEGD